MVRRMIQLLQQLQEQLNIGSISVLKPRLILVGSVPEGTKIGKVTECDVMMKLEGLQDNPFQLLDGDAMTLRFPCMDDAHDITTNDPDNNSSSKSPPKQQL